ncbi:MAG: LITAF-like zinc ribbon domain-containing protein [Armatimonadota bacterium]
MKTCPRCGSNEIEYIDNEPSFACFGCVFFMPIMLILPLIWPLFKKKKPQHHCTNCGFDW